MNQLTNELDVLNAISVALVRERHPDALLQKVLDVLTCKMGMLRATFTLRRADLFEIVASQGLDTAEKRRGCYRLGEGITGEVAASGRALIVPDISKDSRFLNRTGARKSGETVAFLCVPLLHHERVVGTLSIDRQIVPDIDLEEDLRLLQIVGNLLAEAVGVFQQEYEERSKLEQENRQLRQALNGPMNPTSIIGTSGIMQTIYRLIQQVAPSDATVLIRGSSGTGKELVARAIQELSPRAKKPFITLNCAALPEALIESELFGHEKGAFTGAVSQRVGRVEAANGGTLFLDEIGDLSLPVQVKLLRFLQERTFSPVGSNEERRTDVRLIAATSRNLEELMSEHKFREDLYYRLNIFPIALPDLAKRRSDILLLAEHFIEKFNRRYKKAVKRLSTPAINMLMAYHWPGNVRELENCIERAILTTTDDSIQAYNLPPSLQVSEETIADRNRLDETQSFSGMVAGFERELIVEALKKQSGNVAAAARQLSLSTRMMHYNIKRLNITPDWYRTASGRAES